MAGVRIHADANASTLANRLSSHAFTTGRDIFFAPGMYDTGTRSGRALLAHELTHVVQQAGSIKTLQRRSIFESIAGLFAGDLFSPEELRAYLAKLDKTGQIEDYNESDNKARAIVNGWRLGGSPYALTIQRKILLIKEMQSGATGDDDEMAILEILERSYNFELTAILAAIPVTSLESDFHGEEWERLKDFFDRRFDGGFDAVAKGVRKPRGLPVSLGSNIQSTSLLDRDLAGATRTWTPACVLGILCSLDAAVVQTLPTLTVKTADEIRYENPYYDGSTWTTKTFLAGGIANHNEKLIIVLSGDGCDRTAETLVHEVRHQHQPTGLSVAERERDAYISTEEWSIARGLAGNPGFRKTNPTTGEIVPDTAAIDAMIKADYPGVSSVPGERVVSRTAAGNTVVRRPDGTRYERAPQLGDSYQAPRQLVNEKTIPKDVWKCPATKGAP